MSRYYHYTKPARARVNESLAIQILGNAEFEVPHTDAGVVWQSSTGWGGSANPVIGGNALVFTYLERTVYQSVTVQDYGLYSNALLELAVSRHPAKTDAQNVFNILINFRNSSNDIVATHRYPAAGNANTSGADWHEISDEFTLPNEQVTSIEVRVTGWETGFWAGQYGPRFNYVKLTLS